MRTTPESELLTLAEVKAAAGGAARIDDQVRILREQGVPHKVVGRRVLVSRYHLREWLAGRVVAPSSAPKLELVR